MLNLSRPASRYLQLQQRTHIRHFYRVRMVGAAKSRGKSRSGTEQHQDPIVAEEIEGTSNPQISNPMPTSKRTNACKLKKPCLNTTAPTHNAVTELMGAKKPKPTPGPAETPSKPVKRGFDARNGLGLYIEHPEKNPEGLVVEYDDDFVVINDKFPKARYPLTSPQSLYGPNADVIVCTSSSSHVNQSTTTHTLYICSPPTRPSWPKCKNA